MQLYESFMVYLINILCSLLPLGKCLFTSPKNFFSDLSTYYVWLSYPAFWRAWQYVGAAFWKVSWFDGVSDTRLEIAFGRLRVMDGGWFESLLLIYMGSLFGLRNGMCRPVLRSRVTSK